jgi:hypothetical protein
VAGGRGARSRTLGTPFLIAPVIRAQHLCLPMTNEDALRAVRPRVAEWIDKLRHGGDVVFVPKEDLQLAHEVSALRSACASAISGNSGVGEKSLSTDDAIAGDCSEECRIGRIALEQNLAAAAMQETRFEIGMT